MRPKMKYPRNEISICHEKIQFKLLFVATGMKRNFVMGVVDVKQSIKKFKQSRARYKDNHVGGNNAGIY